MIREIRDFIIGFRFKKYGHIKTIWDQWVIFDTIVKIELLKEKEDLKEYLQLKILYCNRLLKSFDYTNMLMNKI